MIVYLFNIVNNTYYNLQIIKHKRTEEE